MPRTVLLVDDDPHIRQVLVFAFGKAGMESIEARDGEEALALAAEHAPDLIVLDINMPRMDGLEVCRRLRGEGQVPILFLSSRDDEIDRVLGIELGGDDYVVKPFSPREVVARASAILRRSAGQSTPVAADAAAGLLRHGALALDGNAWSASWQGGEVELTVTEFNLLRTLAATPGRIFSRDQLIDRLHGPGFAITDRTIDSHVRNLRRKFADAGCHDLVETKAGVGYRLGACLGGERASG
ncbi:chemotaxis protein CheY [Erythrobacter sp. SG61-1L]|uniref:response regulator transcription factor n=1 Tax=Erythrobacter sp. SG61-1L TaxID=1603897 RepID=UPI0006C921A2|nr:response regulator transcription factor [Erythrobacter sp. SG61-1L]KPL68742.1 chemotaxis protein CheY [Erythrobacter sp. SG61-1L]